MEIDNFPSPTLSKWYYCGGGKEGGRAATASSLATLQSKEFQMEVELLSQGYDKGRVNTWLY